MFDVPCPGGLGWATLRVSDNSSGAVGPLSSVASQAFRELRQLTIKEVLERSPSSLAMIFAFAFSAMSSM